MKQDKLSWPEARPTKLAGTLLAAVLAAGVLAGCGGRTDAGVASPPTAATPPAGAITTLVALMERLIGADESSDPIDIDTVALVADDAAEPSPFSF